MQIDHLLCDFGWGKMCAACKGIPWSCSFSVGLGLSTLMGSSLPHSLSPLFKDTRAGEGAEGGDGWGADRDGKGRLYQACADTPPPPSVATVPFPKFLIYMYVFQPIMEKHVEWTLGNKYDKKLANAILELRNKKHWLLRNVLFFLGSFEDGSKDTFHRHSDECSSVTWN